MVSATVPGSDAIDTVLEKLRQALSELHRPGIARLCISRLDGKLVLSGRVGSFYERQLAIRQCQTILGSGQVIDAVEVD